MPSKQRHFLAIRGNRGNAHISGFQRSFFTNIIKKVLAKTGLAYSGVASSQSEPKVCRAEAESPAADQGY